MSSTVESFTPPKKDEETIFSAAINGNISYFQNLSDTSKINAVDSEGNTPLHLAAYKGHSDLVALLIAKGADVEARNKLNQTPLTATIDVSSSSTAADTKAKGDAKTKADTATPEKEVKRKKESNGSSSDDDTSQSRSRGKRRVGQTVGRVDTDESSDPSLQAAAIELLAKNYAYLFIVSQAISNEKLANGRPIFPVQMARKFNRAIFQNLNMFPSGQRDLQYLFEKHAQISHMASCVNSYIQSVKNRLKGPQVPGSHTAILDMIDSPLLDDIINHTIHLDVNSCKTHLLMNNEDREDLLQIDDKLFEDLTKVALKFITARMGELYKLYQQHVKRDASIAEPEFEEFSWILEDFGNKSDKTTRRRYTDSSQIAALAVSGQGNGDLKRRQEQVDTSLTTRSAPILDQGSKLIKRVNSFLRLNDLGKFSQTCTTARNACYDDLPVRAARELFDRFSQSSDSDSLSLRVSTELLDWVLNIDETRKKKIRALLSRTKDMDMPSVMLTRTNGRELNRTNTQAPKERSNESPLEGAALSGDFHAVDLLISFLPKKQREEAGKQLLELRKRPDYLSRFFAVYNAYNEFFAHRLVDEQAKKVEKVRKADETREAKKVGETKETADARKAGEVRAAEMRNLWGRLGDAQAKLPTFGLQVYCTRPWPFDPDANKEPKRDLYIPRGLDTLGQDRALVDIASQAPAVVQWHPKLATDASSDHGFFNRLCKVIPTQLDKTTGELLGRAPEELDPHHGSFSALAYMYKQSCRSKLQLSSKPETASNDRTTVVPVKTKAEKKA